MSLSRLFRLSLCAAALAGAVSAADRLPNGGKLYAGQALVCPTGHHHAKLMPDGDFVLRFRDGHVYWSAGTTGKAVNGCVAMQEDNNLVVYDAQGHAVWQSGTVNQGSARADLVIHEDGNLQVVAGGQVLWQSGPAPDHHD